ncbi:MAG: hypothetical protein Q8N96_04340 [Methylovulum sp.]|nr:hypothetical protein [Methylovulum sp.]
MKKSTPRFSTQRWDNFATDIDVQEDGFLQTRPDDTGLTITPLDHIADDDNEDAIDRLLANSGFDTEGQATQTAAFAATAPVIKPVADDSAFVIGPLHEERPNAANFQVDAFISDYLAMRQPEQSADSKPELRVETIGSSNGPMVQPEKPAQFERECLPDTADDATLRYQLDTDPASIEKQLAQLQKQMSTAMRIAYAALACSLAILICTAVLYTMISDIKTDTAKMTVWVEAFKEALEAAAEAPDGL